MLFRLSNQLNDTTGLLDLLLCQLAHPSCADNQGDFGETALAEDLGVAEGEEVEDGGGVLLGTGDVSLTGLGGDERPELVSCQWKIPLGKPDRFASSRTRVKQLVLARSDGRAHRSRGGNMYLLQVDDRLPEVVGLLVEVSHTNLTEVTGMVLFSKPG